MTRASPILFPIMDAPDIPWEILAPHERRAQQNHSQSLKRLAERGGLAAWEAVWIIRDLPIPFGAIPREEDGPAELAKLVAVYQGDGE